jgi:hypothetical protein
MAPWEIVMRLYFPDMHRPKKASKRLSAVLSVPLAAAQRAVARASGFGDWHEMERQFNAGPICPLDQSLSSPIYVERLSHLTMAIAEELSVADGDVQFALTDSRLTGDRQIDLTEQIAIRLTCFRANRLPSVGARQAGAVGTLNVSGRRGEAVILRHFGRPTETISDRGITTIADFEYVSPRCPPQLFLPIRLYLPYGVWTELDNARVLFSRDYKPLWRLREGRSPERVEPWLHIRFKEQAFLWHDAETPWQSAELRRFLEHYLIQHDVSRLPILTDALPFLVHSEISGLKMSDAAQLLRAARTPHPAVA